MALHSLLSSQGKDFLVRNDGEEVKIESLKGKNIGLYFSDACHIASQWFTFELVAVYNVLSPEVDFEIVFVSSGDEDEESFNNYFKTMPWLAVPFTDSETRDRLNALFKLTGFPNLVMVDEHGAIMKKNQVKVIQRYGPDAYPFTPKRIKEMKEEGEEEEEEDREQTLESVLVTPSRDFVISKEGEQVPVSVLKGKIIGILFLKDSRRCTHFTTPKLVEFYNKLKESSVKDFEIVMIYLDNDEESFKRDFATMPWLALPFNDGKTRHLATHFKVSALPALVILGPDGKTRHLNVVEAVEDHGVLAYPFTPEEFKELDKLDKEKADAQTLESLLVSGDLNNNYVLKKDGDTMLVSELVGKNVLFYFSAKWCGPCRGFTTQLVDVYNQLKQRGEAFELIFINRDKNEEEYKECYSQMPWLALPFGDPRIESLEQNLKVFSIPTLVALGPTGKTVTKEAKNLVQAYGADAYPFTKTHLDEMVNGWPNKLKHHPLHEVHELELTPVHDFYMCNNCNEPGYLWSYHCDECEFDLHAKCALKEETKDEAVKDGE